MILIQTSFHTELISARLVAVGDHEVGLIPPTTSYTVGSKNLILEKPVALSDADYSKLRERIQILERDNPTPPGANAHVSASGHMAETAYFDLLRLLLAQEGFVTKHITLGINLDDGCDLRAVKPGSPTGPEVNLGVIFKYRQASTDVLHVVDIQRALQRTWLNGFNRLMIVANRTFTQNAKSLARQSRPVSVELVDIQRLKSWLEGYRSVVELTSEFARRLVTLISVDPTQIYYIGWRKIEEMMGEIFSELGFKIEVTPSSQDGGKDVVCTCTVSGKERTFYIEIKHHKTTVARKLVKNFVEVVGRDEVDGGLYLSTGGYGPSAFKVIAASQRPIALGASDKIIKLCRVYRQSRAGLLQPVPDKWDFLQRGTKLLQSA